MHPTKRIIVNTAVQYTKSILTILISLYSTRIILDSLGVNDYGIYVLVAGVTAMLGFITNALVVTTQRYISYYSGKKDMDKTRLFFSNSMYIHLMIGLALSLLLLCCKGFVFREWLNIDSSRVSVAEWVYVMTIVILFLSIIIAPFKSVFIARENMVFISVVEFLDAVLKLMLAFSLVETNYDKLIFYSVMMMAIQICNLLAFGICACCKYKECRLVKQIDKNIVRQLCGFAGWTTYGMGVVVARNQGMAIMLNHFFGTIINAAYGIAFQVYGAISFVSTSILNAMNPQIMEATGSGDRNRMMNLIEKESLYSSILMALVSIPVMMEMPQILQLWLKEVPDNTSMFCIFILLGFLIDQTTYGINTGVQAIGKLKVYTLLMYTPKLLSLILVWCFLSYGYSPTSIMILYIVVEMFVALIRLFYFKREVKFSIINYVKSVLLPILLLCLILCTVSGCVEWCCNISYRFLLTILAACVSGIAFVWYIVLTDSEKQFVCSFIRLDKK